MNSDRLMMLKMSSVLQNYPKALKAINDANIFNMHQLITKKQPLEIKTMINNDPCAWILILAQAKTGGVYLSDDYRWTDYEHASMLSRMNISDYDELKKACHPLFAFGFTTLGDIVEAPISMIRGIYNFGNTGFEVLSNVLAAYGYFEDNSRDCWVHRKALFERITIEELNALAHKIRSEQPVTYESLKRNGFFYKETIDRIENQSKEA